MLTCIAANGPNTFRGEGPCRRLLAGTPGGLAVLERSGADSPWTVTGVELEGQHISSTAYEPKLNLLAVGTMAGKVFFSTDLGETWEERSSGLPDGIKVWNVAFVQKAEGTVFYAGVEPPAMYESRDLGRNWTDMASIKTIPGIETWTYPPPPHIAHINSLAADPRNPELMYVGVEQGAILKTEDGGKTWIDLKGWANEDDTQYKDVHQVVLRPSNPDEIYMTVGIGFYYSPDKGNTWERLTDESFRIGYPDRLVVSPDNDRHLLVTGAETNPITWFKLARANGTVMRSHDGGRNWHDATRGLPDTEGNVEGLAIYVWEGGYTVFTANTEGKIFSSEDFGENWTTVVADLAEPVTKSGHSRLLAAAKAAKAAKEAHAPA